MTRRARTNSDGRYTILFPDGGGLYQLTVRFLGMAPSTVNVAHVADEDRLFQARYTLGPDRTRDLVRGALAQRGPVR